MFGFRIQTCLDSFEDELDRCTLEHVIVSCYAALGIHADAVRWGEQACANIDDILLLRNTPAEEKSLKQLKGRILSDVADVHFRAGQFESAQRLSQYAKHLLHQHGDQVGHAKALLAFGCIR